MIRFFYLWDEFIIQPGEIISIENYFCCLCHKNILWSINTCYGCLLFYDKRNQNWNKLYGTKVKNIGTKRVSTPNIIPKICLRSVWLLMLYSKNLIEKFNYSKAEAKRYNLKYNDKSVMPHNSVLFTSRPWKKKTYIKRKERNRPTFSVEVYCDKY